MVTRRIAALVFAFLFAGASGASAAQGVQPQPGVLLTGKIQFPRAQEMAVQTDPRDGSKLTALLGFDGKCKGGGLAALWASNIPAGSTVQAKDGRFAATLTGKRRDLGGVEGRTGKFRWRFVGRFVAPDVITATVSGSGEIRVRGKKVSRCKIASPAPVRLTIRA
jgi:hypothetical protein